MTETNCSKITQYLLRKCYSTVHFNQLQFQCQYLVRLPWLQLQDNKLCKQECQDVSRTSGRYMYQSDQIRSYSVESLVYQQHLLQWHCARSTLGKCSLANVAGYAKDNYILGKSGQKNCVRILSAFFEIPRCPSMADSCTINMNISHWFSCTTSRHCVFPFYIWYTLHSRSLLIVKYEALVNLCLGGWFSLACFQEVDSELSCHCAAYQQLVVKLVSMQHSAGGSFWPLWQIMPCWLPLDWPFMTSHSSYLALPFLVWPIWSHQKWKCQCLHFLSQKFLIHFRCDAVYGAICIWVFSPFCIQIRSCGLLAPCVLPIIRSQIGRSTHIASIVPM